MQISKAKAVVKFQKKGLLCKESMHIKAHLCSITIRLPSFSNAIYVTTLHASFSLFFHCMGVRTTLPL